VGAPSLASRRAPTEREARSRARRHSCPSQRKEIARSPRGEASESDRGRGQKILGHQRRSESQPLDTYSCNILHDPIGFCSLLGSLVPSVGAPGETRMCLLRRTSENYSSRDCLETPQGLHYGVLRVCRMRRRSTFFGRLAPPKGVRSDPHSDFPDSLSTHLGE
jgi:hypothetical protein